MATIEVLEGKDEVVVRAELPGLQQRGLLQVVKATFKDGVLEVVMEPSRQEVAPPTDDDVKPSKIFPE